MGCDAAFCCNCCIEEPVVFPDGVGFAVGGDDADGEDDPKKGTQLLEVYALEIQMLMT